LHWEILCEPTIDAAGEDSDGSESQMLEVERRPGTRNLVRSPAIQNDVVIAGNLLKVTFQFSKR
jgi:hypothetical protein